MSGPAPRDIAAALLARERTAAAWDLELEEARAGYARVAMAIRPDMLNGHGTAHGGMIFALADTAFAYACNSRNVATVAQAATIHFLAPAPEGERLVAEAKEVALSGRAGSYAVDFRGEGGRMVATFHGLSRSVGGSIIATGENHG